MSTERLVVPGLSVEDEAALVQMWDQLMSHQPGNTLRTIYHDGEKNLRKWSDHLPGSYLRLGNVLGWTSKAVSTLARRCNIDSIQGVDADLDALGFPALARANRLIPTLHMAIYDSIKTSCSFLVVTRGDEGEPPALLHAKTALNATGIWSWRTRSLTYGLSVDERDDKGKPSKLSMYAFNRTGITQRTDGRWSEMQWTEHSYGMPMEVLPYQPDLTRPFGRSRITREMMGIQDSAARAVCRLEAHMDAYSMPDYWMLGGASDDVVDDAGTTVDALVKRAGRIRGIPDNEESTVDSLARVDIKQFPAASPQPHLEQLKWAAQAFSGLASIPLTSLGVSDMSNPTSADSYIASREDLIAEAEGTTDDMTDPIARSVQKLLQVANGLSEVPDEWGSIAPSWRSPVFLSRAAAADAGAKQIGAVPDLASTSVGLELLGLDQAQIERVQGELRRSRGRDVMAALAAQMPPGES